MAFNSLVQNMILALATLCIQGMLYDIIKYIVIQLTIYRPRKKKSGKPEAVADVDTTNTNTGNHDPDPGAEPEATATNSPEGDAPEIHANAENATNETCAETPLA